MDQLLPGDTAIGVVLGVSAATVVAICGAFVAWLKWHGTSSSK